MKVLLCVAELQSLEETKAKEELLSLWAEVNEAEIIGVISELNATNVLGIAAKKRIFEALSRYEVDAVVVADAHDFSRDKKEICEYVGYLHELGVDVISVANNLPSCADCLAEAMSTEEEPHRRAYHCTVTIFNE